jgi:hypothetical protein
MLNFLATAPIAQATPANLAPTPPAVQYIIEEQPVRRLPGGLDKVPVFNSNSPEVVESEGILLSTLSPQGRANASAHLNYSFSDRFDIFTHHIARPNLTDPQDKRRLNLGIVVHNSGSTAVQIDILQSLSYTTAEDAPFQLLPPYVNNPDGRFYSGPGSRLATDILRGVSEPPSQIIIPPGQSRVIFNRPIPNSSARSGLMRLRSSGKVQVASLTLFDRVIQPPAPILPEPLGPLDSPPPLPPVIYEAPHAADWQAALETLPLATPRDLVPTKPGQYYGALIYGRVAGVSEGSRWEGFLTDDSAKSNLAIPERGKAFSYVLNTPDYGTLGTGQVQSARLLVRYPDTAYDAHGNYATHYRLTLPLKNNTNSEQVVAIKFQTPLKDEFQRDRLRFNAQTSPNIFFRGTVQLTYPSDNPAEPVVRSIHLIQRQGEQGKPLMALKLAPGERKLVELELVYPPDATPPQVVTVESFDPAQPPQLPAEKLLPLIEVDSPF